MPETVDEASGSEIGTDDVDAGDVRLLHFCRIAAVIDANVVDASPAVSSSGTGVTLLVGD